MLSCTVITSHLKIVSVFGASHPLKVHSLLPGSSAILKKPVSHEIQKPNNRDGKVRVMGIGK